MATPGVFIIGDGFIYLLLMAPNVYERRLDMVKTGDKVHIIYMKNEPLYNDAVGIVTLIDDAGQIHGTWGGCALIPGVDLFEIIDKKQEKQ